VRSEIGYIDGVEEKKVTLTKANIIFCYFFEEKRKNIQ